jgi:glyoxylase-like metal-dependent hydrolase (beta-lactamase superfamily II)
MGMKWDSLTVGAFGMNAYILWCEKTKAGILVDPGDQIDDILERVNAHGVNLERIIITHAHIDHILHAHEAQTRLKIPLYLHPDDELMLKNVPAQAAMFGLPAEPVPTIDGYLHEGDVVRFGEVALTVRHTPGHSRGAISLIGEGHAIVGDVLFLGSIGRTDLPGGSFEILLTSIREKLLTLPDSVQVLSGHGEPTTIGFERLNNPFLQ